MMRSTAEHELEAWIMGAMRVYSYLGDDFVTEYIVFTKKSADIFECERELSTHYLGHQSKDTITKLLMSDRLVFREPAISWFNYRKLKTGGCECGGWATSNPNCHAFSCPMYGK